MALDNYPLNRDSENFYWFVSSGVNRDTLKGIFLDPAEFTFVSNVYNLGLADYINEDWTDENRTNNGNMPKVMETVATVVIQYLEAFPERKIFVRGNTPAKRRLYQRFVSNNLEAITAYYDLFGKPYDDDTFELFEKGKIYEALLVQIR